MHCHKTGLGAQCAHPEPRARTHCARSAHVVGAAARTASWSRAQPEQVARMLGVHWLRHAQAACPRPGRNAKSRLRHLITTGQVATSNRCRDPPLFPPQKRTCRDPKPWSRHQDTTRQPEPCRDIKSVSRHRSSHSRPRPQNGVATSFPLPSPRPGRYFLSRSRPP